jgi:hypothetical protein
VTNQDFAAPVQPKIGAESRKVREIPASADVAQLVEHFTRNEGVRGSSPRVGFRICRDFLIPVRAELDMGQEMGQELGNDEQRDARTGGA